MAARRPRRRRQRVLPDPQRRPAVGQPAPDRRHGSTPRGLGTPRLPDLRGLRVRGWHRCPPQRRPRPSGRLVPGDLPHPERGAGLDVGTRHRRRRSLRVRRLEEPAAARRRRPCQPEPRANVDTCLAGTCDRRRRRRGVWAPRGRGMDGPWRELRAAVARWRPALAPQGPAVGRAGFLGRRPRHPGRRRGVPPGFHGLGPRVERGIRVACRRPARRRLLGEPGRPSRAGRYRVEPVFAASRPPDRYAAVWSASADDGATWSASQSSCRRATVRAR